MSKSVLTNISICFLLFVLLIIGSTYWVSALGVALWLFTFISFIQGLGKTIPILELMVLMATSQWILGAWFAYLLNFQHYKYFMYVDEQTYMDYVVPGTYAMILGINIPKWRNYKFLEGYRNLLIVMQSYRKIPYYLIGVGFIAPYLSFILPSSLRFVLFLLSNLKYIGAVYLLFQPKGTSKAWIIWSVLILTFISSVQAGMFHDFLLWSVIMMTFLSLRLQWGIGKNYY